MSTKSLIRSQIFLYSKEQNKEFENNLIDVEIQGNHREFNVPIEYDQPIAFRHKMSHKYLGISAQQQDDDEQDQEHDVKFRLELTDTNKLFRVIPCFQYQTKISMKIKFNQDIYLSTDLSTRNGFISVNQTQVYQLQAFAGFNIKSKFSFQLHSLYQKQQKHFIHGKIMWLSHIESGHFLSNETINNRQEIVFEKIKMDKQIHNLKALWTIQGDQMTVSGRIKYDQEVRLKNLYNGQYLCFSEHYRLVDNERIYQILMEENASEYSKFVFRSIIQVESKQFQKGVYLSLMHCQSTLYVGCRREAVGLDCRKFLTFQYADDQDLFKINQFNQQKEQALRFIFTIRKEFRYNIHSIIETNIRDISFMQFEEIKETYLEHDLSIIYMQLPGYLQLNISRYLIFLRLEFDSLKI